MSVLHLNKGVRQDKTRNV